MSLRSFEILAITRQLLTDSHWTWFTVLICVALAECPDYGPNQSVVGSGCDRHTQGVRPIVSLGQTGPGSGQVYRPFVYLPGAFCLAKCAGRKTNPQPGPTIHAAGESWIACAPDEHGGHWTLGKPLKFYTYWLKYAFGILFPRDRLTSGRRKVVHRTHILNGKVSTNMRAIQWLGTCKPWKLFYCKNSSDISNIVPKTSDATRSAFGQLVEHAVTTAKSEDEIFRKW